MYVSCKEAMVAETARRMPRPARTQRTISRQQERTEATRAKLLAAAEHIFARDGFEASRLEDIAAHAGYTRGAFYANFESKEDLLFALMERLVTERVEAIRAVLERCDTASARMRAARDYYAQIACDRRWALLVLEFKLFAIRHADARVRLVERYRRLRAPGRDLFDSLLRQLGRKLPVSSNAATIGLSAVSNALLLESLMDPKALTPSEIQILLSLFFDALVGSHAG
jgi:AcrR family transcriptional regulator